MLPCEEWPRAGAGKCRPRTRAVVAWAVVVFFFELEELIGDGDGGDDCIEAPILFKFFAVIEDF